VEKKLGRNDPCRCGSGRKFKHCCDARSKKKELSWEDQVLEAGHLSLGNTPEGPKEATGLIEQLLGVSTLTPFQKIHGLLNLSRAQQHGGDFAAALATLERVQLTPEMPHGKALALRRRLDRASCLCALGKTESAASEIRSVVDVINGLPEPDKSGVLLEAGKIFSFSGETDLAEDCWQGSVKGTKDDPKQVETYARALANLADLRLKRADDASQMEGLAMMQAAATLKVNCGDLHGLANTYDLLGLYHWRNGRFEPALAFLRKDLALSRQVGDQRGLAQTLTNLAGLYGQMRQPTYARQMLREAQLIADTLNNPSLSNFVALQSSKLEENVRNESKNGATFGPDAPCVCQSGKAYDKCCGRADFEPIGLPWNFGGSSQDTREVDKELVESGVKPTRLDRFLAESTAIEGRIAWYKVFPRPGWHEVQELPDIANIHLTAARRAAEAATEDTTSYEWPLSALVMAVCSLEAFINQVTFFLAEASQTEDLGLGALPSEIVDAPFAFQRKTELTQKWHLIGTFLCGSSWPPAFWTDFTNLVYVRNEFVHFKLSNYEQIIPPPKKPPQIASRLPAGFKLRGDHHSWPFEILTAELAQWAVRTSENMFRTLRHEYAALRRSQSKDQSSKG
jgi:tetratricopeptide (TPR) repeat protein